MADDSSPPARDGGLPSARDTLPPPARAPGPSAAARPGSAPARAPGYPPQPRPGSPPLSVREAAGAVEIPAPAREVTVDDRVWVVRQKGAGKVGYGGARGARGARILSVGVEARVDGEGPDATRYVLARSLSEVAEEDLVSLVREASRAPDPSG